MTHKWNVMSDHADCALPKNESNWMGGVRMKDINNPSLKQEIEKFKRVLIDVPEPNFGRIRELKEKIRKKTLLTKEAIEETAERLAARFLGRD